MRPFKCFFKYFKYLFFNNVFCNIHSPAPFIVYIQFKKIAFYLPVRERQPNIGLTLNASS